MHGDHFTFADINLLPILYRFLKAPEGAETPAAAIHLAAYYGRHASRPPFARTIPPPAYRAGPNQVDSAMLNAATRAL